MTVCAGWWLSAGTTPFNAVWQWIRHLSHCFGLSGLGRVLKGIAGNVTTSREGVLGRGSSRQAVVGRLKWAEPSTGQNTGL